MHGTALFRYGFPRKFLPVSMIRKSPGLPVLSSKVISLQRKCYEVYPSRSTYFLPESRCRARSVAQCGFVSRLCLVVPMVPRLLHHDMIFSCWHISRRRVQFVVSEQDPRRRSYDSYCFIIFQSKLSSSCAI